MDFENIHRTTQRSLQTPGDAANKQMQSQQQLKPPSHLEVSKAKSPQLITNQRSPGPSQGNPVIHSQKQVNSQNASTSQSQVFAAGNVGPQGSTSQSQSASIATVVEVGTSQYKSAGGGSCCMANLNLVDKYKVIVFGVICF